MGEIRISLANFLTIGIIAFVFIFAANRVLARTGMGNWVV